MPEVMFDEIEFFDAKDYFRDQKVSRELYQYSLQRLFRLIFGNIFRMLRRIIS